MVMFSCLFFQMAGRQIVLNSNNDPDKDRDMVQNLLGKFLSCRRK